MGVEIRDLKKDDYKKAIQFAIKGMHFDWYLNNRSLLNAYGRYFWYLEINRATQIIAAYVGDKLVGVLLAELYAEEPKQNSRLQKLYVKIVDGIQKVCFKGGAGLYENTVRAQLERYVRRHKPDGEIIFLAADPDSKVKGVGSALLNALEERTRGRTIYLHTDDACTYQFYEHRGFECMDETDIVLEMPKGKVPLRCFIYSKTVQ